MHRLQSLVRETLGKSKSVSLLTFFRRKVACVFDVQIRECTVNMRAYFLPCLGRPKDPDNRNLGLLGQLLRLHIVAQLWVISGRRRLIKVDAVQSNLERIHVDNDAFLLSVVACDTAASLSGHGTGVKEHCHGLSSTIYSTASSARMLTFVEVRRVLVSRYVPLE